MNVLFHRRYCHWALCFLKLSFLFLFFCVAKHLSEPMVITVYYYKTPPFNTWAVRMLQIFTSSFVKPLSTQKPFWWLMSKAAINTKGIRVMSTHRTKAATCFRCEPRDRNGSSHQLKLFRNPGHILHHSLGGFFCCCCCFHSHWPLPICSKTKNYLMMQAHSACDDSSVSHFQQGWKL